MPDQADTQPAPVTHAAPIRPFRIVVPQAALDDLHERLARTCWPDELPGVGWRQGAPLDYARELAAYWRDRFAWRAWESMPNAPPQFATERAGQTVHVLNVRSPEPDALPLILTGGWSGSIVEVLIGSRWPLRGTGSARPARGQIRAFFGVFR